MRPEKDGGAVRYKNPSDNFKGKSGKLQVKGKASLNMSKGNASGDKRKYGKGAANTVEKSAKNGGMQVKNGRPIRKEGWAKPKPRKKKLK